MQEVKWKINSFGKFSVIRNDTNITAKNKRFSKKWKLFQYLLTYRKKKISHSKLIEVLDLEDSYLPVQALSALVYRLRKQLLGDLFNKIDDNKQLICRKPGCYYFNNESNYIFDGDILEKAITDCRSNLSLNKNSEKLIETFDTAWNIYKQGDYLDTVKHNDDWLISSRDNYRNTLVNLLSLIRKSLASNDSCIKLEGYYQKLIERHPLNAELIIGYINLLQCIGDNYFALHKLEYYLARYYDRNLKVPARLIEMKKNLKSNNKIFDLGIDLQDNKSLYEERKAYLTSPGTFMEIFEVEYRRRFIVNYDSFIINLSRKTTKKNKENQNQVLDFLKEGLRPGDIFTPWDNKTVLALMVDISEEELKIILSRIIRFIQENYNIEFNYNFVELDNSKSNFKPTDN